MNDFQVEDFDLELGFESRLIRVFFASAVHGLEKAAIFFRSDYDMNSRGYEDPDEKRIVILRPLSSFSDYVNLLNSEGAGVNGGWLSYLNGEIVTFILQTEKKTPCVANTPQARPEPLAFPPS